MLILFCVKGYAPFGGKSLAWKDANIQYFDFYAYFRDVLHGKNSISYTFSKTLGGTNAAVFSYYLSSPLMLLILFFDNEHLSTFFDMLVTLRLMLAATTFLIFLRGRFAGRWSDGWKKTTAVVLSVSYPISQYTIAQACNVMWLIGVYMLPLILLFVYQIADGQKASWKLAVTVGVSIIFNWYTAGINCIFACVWFLFEIALHPEGQRQPVRRIIRCIPGLGVGIMISAVIFLPTVSALRNGNRGTLDLGELLNPSLIGDPLSSVTRYMYGAASSKSEIALFAGCLAVIGFLSFYFSKKTPGKNKAAAGVMTAFTLMMLYWNPLFMVFSLFKNATSYYSRYSYLNIFFMLFLAAAWFSTAEKEQDCLLPVKTAAIFAGALTVFNYLRNDGNLNEAYLTAGMALLISAIYALSMTRYYRKNPAERISGAALSLTMVAVCTLDLGINASLMMDRYHVDDVQEIAAYYSAEKEQINSIKDADTGCYRISQTATRTTRPDSNLTANFNEALAYNYWSISGYTSSPDDNQRAFLENLGYTRCGENMNIVTTSIVGADALLGVKYVLSPYAINGLVKDSSLTAANGKDVYVNPYALPMAFCFHGKIDNDRLDKTNPFLYQNSVYSQLLGRATELYRPLNYEITQEGDASFGTPMQIRVHIPEGNLSVYGNFPASSWMNASISVDGKFITRYSQWLSPSVIYLPSSGSDVTVELNAENSYSALEGDKIQFYALDLDQLKEVTEELSSRTPDKYSMENGSVYACVESAGDGDQLCLSVPVDKGWTVTDNGEKVRPDSIDGCMTITHLHRGKNEIRMEYHTPWLKEGIAVTIFGITGAALLFIFSRKNLFRFRPQRSVSSP